MSFEKRKLKWPRRAYLGPLSKADKKLSVEERVSNAHLAHFKKVTKWDEFTKSDLLKVRRVLKRAPAPKPEKYLGPLAVLSPEKKPKRLRPRSARMTKLMDYYRQKKAYYLASHPNCVACAKPHPAEDIHHTRGKIGTLRLDERFWLGLCRAHHCFTEDEKEMARAEGLLCAKGDWNKAPDDSETRRLKLLIQDLTK